MSSRSTPRFTPRSTRVLLALMMTVFVSTLGCAPRAKPPVVPPDYTRPLDSGGSGLVKITDPADMPDLAKPYGSSDDRLLTGIDRSLGWFTKPSSRRYFPVAGITHEHAQTSVYAFRETLRQSASAEAFTATLKRDFDVYTSIGWNGKGDVLYTAYYTPVLQASVERTARYRFPLYRRPSDLVTDPDSGQTIGRMIDGEVVPYPTRREIETSTLLEGQELVWLDSRFSQYLAHIQGSARLILRDGTTMDVGYAGNNGYDYTSIGLTLVREGKIDRNRLSLPEIRRFFRENPGDLDRYIHLNDRFVFFQPYDPGVWPAGSLGFQVLPMRSLATDKSVFPPASVTMVSVQMPIPDGTGERPFDQFMLDHDTGGAIRAAGRADIYIGMGDEAERIAGRVYSEGRLYYLFLKPQAVSQWRSRMASEPTR